MAFPTSIGASQYSAIAMADGAVPASLTETNAVALFAGAAVFDVIKNVRDLPSIGAPSNVVKVPVYGQKTTSSIGAQADAPDLELTVNYIPGEWAPGTALGDAVGSGIAHVFQFSLLSAKPDSYAAEAAGLGTVPNANFYFVGKIESILVNAARDDATTATVALSVQSDFIGPFTV